MKHKDRKGHIENPFKQEAAPNPETPKENETKTEVEVATDDETKLQEDFDNLNNQYLRLAADFDNYRKRQAQERESLIAYGAQDAMKKLIEVFQYQGAAINH